MEVEVDSRGVEAGGVPCDLNELTGIDGLTLGRRLVEATGRASCQAESSAMCLGQDNEYNNAETPTLAAANFASPTSALRTTSERRSHHY